MGVVRAAARVSWCSRGRNHLLGSGPCLVWNHADALFGLQALKLLEALARLGFYWAVLLRKGFRGFRLTLLFDRFPIPMVPLESHNSQLDAVHIFRIHPSMPCGRLLCFMQELSWWVEQLQKELNTHETPEASAANSAARSLD